MIMKTLKIVAILLLIAGFASVNANGQKPIFEEFDRFYSLPFDCMGQTLSGTLSVERIFMDHHRHVRVYGTLTGSEDGLEYDIDMVTNITDKGNWEEWGLKGITYTQPGNIHISRNGKLIAVIHYAYHMTVNALGEVTSEHGDAYECNLVGEGRQPSQFE
jgi:hypothetical protein